MLAQAHSPRQRMTNLVAARTKTAPTSSETYSLLSVIARHTNTLKLIVDTRVTRNITPQPNFERGGHISTQITLRLALMGVPIIGIERSFRTYSGLLRDSDNSSLLAPWGLHQCCHDYTLEWLLKFLLQHFPSLRQNGAHKSRAYTAPLQKPRQSCS
mmetsp:Transcript_18613/g.43582  ORF Transcript_18613/g.43582 Transcript_18613/m.43582 type:complete len:157 (+) Transcript_18613:514-984(+)